jgi:hypothetical protein
MVTILVFILVITTLNWSSSTIFKLHKRKVVQTLSEAVGQVRGFDARSRRIICAGGSNDQIFRNRGGEATNCERASQPPGGRPLLDSAPLDLGGIIAPEARVLAPQPVTAL